MNLPDRKANRLKGFNYGTEGAYFITVCIENRENLLSFVGEGSPLPQLSVFGRITENALLQIPTQYPNMQIDKYVIMPDHVHILLSLLNNGRGNPSPTVNAAMGWFKYKVTKEINERRSSPGKKVFQRSFYDHVIRNEEDYLETWNYIDSNPGGLWEKHTNLEISDR